MSLFKKTMAVAIVAFAFSAGTAFAQAGGGNEMPNAAKEKGTASGGTEGKSEMSNGSMKKDGGAMSKEGGAMKKDGMEKDGMEKSGGKM